MELRNNKIDDNNIINFKVSNFYILHTQLPKEVGYFHSKCFSLRIGVAEKPSLTIRTLFYIFLGAKYIKVD